MDPTLRKSPLISFGVIQFSATPEMKPLSCPSQYRGQSRTIPGERAFHNCSTLEFVRLYVAVAATVYQEPGWDKITLLQAALLYI